jgi:hypothetical protein
VHQSFESGDYSVTVGYRRFFFSVSVKMRAQITGLVTGDSVTGDVTGETLTDAHA